jgi:hypothetical protein
MARLIPFLSTDITYHFIMFHAFNGIFLIRCLSTLSCELGCDYRGKPAGRNNKFSGRLTPTGTEMDPSVFWRYKSLSCECFATKFQSVDTRWSSETVARTSRLLQGTGYSDVLTDSILREFRFTIKFKFVKIRKFLTFVKSRKKSVIL